MQRAYRVATLLAASDAERAQLLSMIRHDVAAGHGVCPNEERRITFEEVVELADTPSIRVTLLVVYKLLILKLISFSSIDSIEASKNGQ